MNDCKCDMRTKLVGDGCEACNPGFALQLANERIAELETALKNLLDFVDEIDTSSGEEVKGSVYYDAKSVL